MVQCAKCSARRATVGCSRSPSYCTGCCRQYAAELTAPCTKHAKRQRAPSGSDDEEDTDVLPIVAEGKEELMPVVQPPPAGISQQRRLAIISILPPAAAATISQATSSAVLPTLAVSPSFS